MEVELEAMRVYLHGAPISKRPKKTLARFGLNWLKRHAQAQAKDQPIADRERRRLEQRNKEAQAQLEALANTKRASTATIREARKDMQQVFDPRKYRADKQKKGAAQ